MHDIFAGTNGDRLRMRCVVCGRRYWIYRQSGLGKPHRCPRKVTSLYELADRVAAILDDPEGPSFSEFRRRHPRLCRKLKDAGLLARVKE